MTPTDRRQLAATSIHALRQDDGLKERLRGLIRQTLVAGLVEGDPLCQALADLASVAPRRADGGELIDPGWGANTKPTEAGQGGGR